MHLAAPAEQRDDPGHVAALDIAGHDVVHAAEPRLGQPSGAHLTGPVFFSIFTVNLPFIQAE
jgi:hypothetical protein